jgi:hypothetical protein
MEKEECKTCNELGRLDAVYVPCPECHPSADAVAATCSAFERAAQICRYYLKHQNFPSRWENKSEYEKGIQIACENLAKAMLEEVGKFKVEPGESLEELARKWERAGFFGVAADIRSRNVNVDSGLKALEVPRLDRATEVPPQVVGNSIGLNHPRNPVEYSSLNQQETF